MKLFVMLLAVAGVSVGPGLTVFTYTGASGGNWATGSNWTPSSGAPPNGTTVEANMGNVASVKLNANETVNQLNFNASSATPILSTSTANTLTFGGTGPTLNLNTTSTNATISAPISIGSGLTIGGTNTEKILILSGQITASSQTINQNGNILVSFNESTNTGWTGGSYNLNKGFMQVANASGLNGTSGPTINVSNVNATAFGGAFTNAVSFSDTGSNDFDVGSPTYRGLDGFTGASGTWSGNITHNLTFTNMPSSLSGTYSSLTFSGAGQVIITDPDGVGGPTGGGNLTINSTSFPSTPVIQLGATPEVGSPGFVWNGSTTMSNQLNLTGSGFFDVTGTGAYSGSVVVNAQNVTTESQTLWIGSLASNGTFSGVISNGGSHTSNFTVNIQGGIQTFSNTNTYSSPTYISASSNLNVTGSINSSTVNLGDGTLEGSGSTGPVQTSGTATIVAANINSPTTSQVLTIGGNLTESHTTAHTFYIDSSGNSSSLQVNGTPTMSGTVVVSGSTGGTPHSYVIMNYTGVSTGSWTTAISGATIVNNTVTKQVTLNTTL